MIKGITIISILLLAACNTYQISYDDGGYSELTQKTYLVETMGWFTSTVAGPFNDYEACEAFRETEYNEEGYECRKL